MDSLRGGSSSGQVRVALSGDVVDNGVTLDVGGMGAILLNDWWSVEVDSVVHNEQWVVVVDDIVVDTDSIQVLLEEVLEEEILLFEGSLLLLDGKLVKMNLVESLVEGVKHLELVVSVGIKTGNLLNIDFSLFHGIRIRLIEWEDLFFLSFEFTAKLGCLENSLSNLLVVSQSFHAPQTVSG